MQTHYNQISCVLQGNGDNNRMEMDILAHKILLETLPPKGTSGRYTLNAEQRLALAARLKVAVVHKAEVEFSLKPASWKNIYRLSGGIKAHLQQTCSVTLEPINEKVAEEFSCYCGTPKDLAELEKKGLITEADEHPEEIIEGAIDVADVAFQYLALGMDMFPRKEGVSLTELLNTLGIVQQDNEPEIPRKQPLAGLATLLDNKA
jgi:hypothetical protein